MSLALWRGFRVVFANPTCSPAKWWSLWLLRSLGCFWLPFWARTHLGTFIIGRPENTRINVKAIRSNEMFQCFVPTCNAPNNYRKLGASGICGCPDQCCHPSQKKTIPAPDHPHLHELAEWEMQLQHFGRTFTDVSVWKTFYPWHHPHERNSRKRTTRFSPLGAIIWG